jgi:sulfite reductase beta subunit-like hemoprotein
VPRRERRLVEGGLYHVYTRCARGEEVFSDPEEAVSLVDVDEFLEAACSALGVEVGQLAGGRRDRETARLRQLVASVGVERWGQRAGRLAARLNKHPVAVSRWESEAARRRQEDSELAEQLRHLDERLDALARSNATGCSNLQREPDCERSLC